MPGMDGRRKNHGGPLYWLSRRSRRFWIVTGVLLPVLYVASFGPACWITSRMNFGASLLPMFYRPIIFAWDLDLPRDGSTNHPLHEALWWFVSVGAADDWYWFGVGADSNWDRFDTAKVTEKMREN
jgi:hypothetical protein